MLIADRRLKETLFFSHVTVQVQPVQSWVSGSHAAAVLLCHPCGLQRCDILGSEMEAGPSIRDTCMLALKEGSGRCPVTLLLMTLYPGLSPMLTSIREAENCVLGRSLQALPCRWRGERTLGTLRGLCPGTVLSQPLYLKVTSGAPKPSIPGDESGPAPPSSPWAFPAGVDCTHWKQPGAGENGFMVAFMGI